MKNKKLILILIATITVIAAATVLSACDKNKGEFVDVGIELYSAKQYYVEGETFTPEGGILIVYSYNEKTKEEKYRFVDLTDKDVTLENTTGARVDTYTVTARYKGLSTRFKYIVQKEENAVSSVDFVLSEDYVDRLKYSVSDIRSEIDFSDFIGMKFVIKYRDTTKQDEEVPLWDENSYRFYDLSYSGFDVKTAGEKYITFTCIATDFVLPYTVTEDDFVYDFEFVKKDKKTNEYFSVKKEDSVRRNYFVEKFDAQNTEIRYIYKSLKKAEPVEISESQISGFDTTTPSDKKMFMLSLRTGVETFNYSVFEEDDVKGVTVNNKDFSQPTPGFNYVWTEKTKREWKSYEEYIEEIQLALVMDEKGEHYVPVTGADEDIILYYVTPDEQDLSLKKEFTEEVFDKLKKTACEYEIIAVYRKNPKVYARRLFFTVKNFITGIDFVNLNVDLVFTEGDAFSFGEAKAIVHYADSNADTEVRLQDEYEKTDENERLIRMKNTKAVEAKTFDMSLGEHKNQYYITANIDVSVYDVTVNGEKFVEDNGFRIYISYVVQKA